jgi:hydroxyethylthiazole kinase-like uncharacterized protein yjeF
VNRFGAVSESPCDSEGFELISTPSEVREMDARTITEWGLSGETLMELAGAQAARLIRERTGGVPGKAVVLCGVGNNGGDGYVVARHLHSAGWSVQVVALGEPREGTDAAKNHARWLRLGEIRVAERGATARMRHWLNHGNVIVDALFGTGLARHLEGAALELIEAANAARHGLKVALDVPSGLDSDRGTILGAAFEADLTTTFGLMKTGLLLGAGPAVAGEIAVVDIAFPRGVIDAVGARARRANEGGLARLIPKRSPEGHKGSFGHVGVIGGAHGMSGAAILAGRGALRAGAGLCTWIRPDFGPAPEANAAPEGLERPAELMTAPLDGALPLRPTVLVVGPGLGRSDAAKALLPVVLADPRPAVYDADLLNLLAECAADLNPLAESDAPDRFALVGTSRVLTPHPLEAARLLGIDVTAVQNDRLASAETLSKLTGAVVVLKGARSIVASPGHPSVLIDIADPTLAVGGSGDVLAGAIAGLMAQGAAPRAAALVGTWAHAAAGRDLGADIGQRGVLASEIADAIPRALAALEGAWTA